MSIFAGPIYSWKSRGALPVKSKDELTARATPEDSDWAAATQAWKEHTVETTMTTNGSSD